MTILKIFLIYTKLQKKEIETKPNRIHYMILKKEKKRKIHYNACALNKFNV